MASLVDSTTASVTFWMSCGTVSSLMRLSRSLISTIGTAPPCSWGLGVVKLVLDVAAVADGHLQRAAGDPHDLLGILVRVGGHVGPRLVADLAEEDLLAGDRLQVDPG